MEKKKKRNLRKEIKHEMKHHKKAFIVYVILRFLILVTLVLQLIRGNYENAFFEISVETQIQSGYLFNKL